jgi:predicted enzyme related to lactoylglutathione lyase
MSLSVYNVAFDCADPYAVASFWSAVTGRPLDDEDNPGDPETSIELDNGVNLYFQRVPEGKTVKNRLHLCLRPDPGKTRDEELERVQALGATIVVDRRRIGGGTTGWVVLADPEGNEFDILHEGVGRD